MDKLDQMENLPLRGKMSWTQAMWDLKTKGCKRFLDWDCTENAHLHWSKKKAKNAKAKHRKKFNR